MFLYISHMELEVIQNWHDKLGHLGMDETVDFISKHVNLVIETL